MKKNLLSAQALQRFAMLLLAGLAMSPGIALAETLSFFGADIVPGDKSVEMLLKPIFGEVFDGPAGGPLVSVVTIFNAACMTVGGILAAYTIIFGTMSTAHDGEMLGKKWSSAWVPIRTALGVGLVAPLASGFCVAQFVIAWVCLQGVGLADSLWTGYIGAAATSQGMAPRVAMPKTRELAKNMLYNLTCVEAGKALAAGGNSVYGGASYGIMNQPNNKGKTYGYADSPSICGALNYSGIVSSGLAGQLYTTNVDMMGNPTGAASTSSSDTGLANSLNLGATPDERLQADTALKAAHLAATQQMEAALIPLAKQIVVKATIGSPANSPVDMRILDKAADDYQRSVAAAAGGVFGGASALQGIKDSATRDGWILAGAWFMRGAQLQDVVNKAASAVPTSEGPTNTSDQTSHDAAFDPYYQTLQASMANSVGEFGIEKQEAPKDGASGFWGKVITKVIGPMVASGNRMSIDTNRHPMMALKDFGDQWMVISETGILVGGGLMAAGGLFSASTMTAALLYFGGLLLIPLGGMMAFATMISVYFPILPFIIYFGTALGWLLLVAEALIAAPLVAVMKLAPGGDDVMGSSRPAYMLILSLLLRPALIVFGFIISLIAVEFILRLFNAVFFPIFFASMGVSMVGLFTMVAAMGIYFGVLTQILHKLFGLTHIVPDQMLRWIGGGHDNLGGTAGALGEHGKGHSAAALAVLSRGGSSTLESGGRQASTMRQMRNQNSLGAKQAARSAASEASDIPKLAAAETSASRNAEAPEATVGHMANAVAAKEELAQKHDSAAVAYNDAGNPQKAQEHASTANKLRGANNKLLQKMENKAEAGAASAVTKEDHQAAATDFKTVRNAYFMAGNSLAAEAANEKANAAEARIGSAPSQPVVPPPPTPQPPPKNDGQSETDGKF